MKIPDVAQADDRLIPAIMDSPIAKHSILLAGQKTSISLEQAFWTRLKEIAERRNVRVSELVHEIDLKRRHNNLSSAIRVFVLEECCARLDARCSGVLSARS